MWWYPIIRLRNDIKFHKVKLMHSGGTHMGKVAISEFVTEPAVKFLRENGYEIVQGDVKTKKDLITLLQGCNGLLIRTAVCDKEVIEAA